MVTKYQKRQMLVGGGIGLLLGIFLSIAIFAMTNHNPVSFVFIPIAAAMGLLQAVFSPAAKEDKK